MNDAIPPAVVLVVKVIRLSPAAMPYFSGFCADARVPSVRLAPLAAAADFRGRFPSRANGTDSITNLTAWSSEIMNLENNAQLEHEAEL